MKRILLSSAILIGIFSCSPKISVRPEPTTQSNYPPLYISKEQINLRSQPGTQASKAATLHDGDAIYISSNIKGWYKVSTDNGENGYVRSDLAAPRTLSRTRMTTAFADSVMPAFAAELYFDKTELYKIIYLTLDASYYESQSKAKSYAEKIAGAYQQRVYPGKIEVRIMHHSEDKLFAKLILPAIGLANIPVPVFDYGVLFSLTEKNKEVSIKMMVPDSIPDKELLRSARKISAAYDYPFRKAEIYMISDSAPGVSYLKDFSKQPLDNYVCRLYYLEDANGEDFKFKFCK